MPDQTKLTPQAAASDNDIGRRQFFGRTGALLGASSLAMSAKSYARVVGSNDRIRIAQLGCGGRSQGHVNMAHLAARRTPVEIVAVCDIWSVAKNARAAQVEKLFGTAPRTYQYSEKMLESSDIDGVMIATGDHQHAKLCVEVVEAGKDCYVEKPFANVLTEAKAARQSVKNSRQIVQMGTQHRSSPIPLLCATLFNPAASARSLASRRNGMPTSRAGAISGATTTENIQRCSKKAIPIGIAGYWASRTDRSIRMSTWNSASIRISPPASSING